MQIQAAQTSAAQAIGQAKNILGCLTYQDFSGSPAAEVAAARLDAAARDWFARLTAIPGTCTVTVPAPDRVADLLAEARTLGGELRTMHAHELPYGTPRPDVHPAAMDAANFARARLTGVYLRLADLIPTA